ncbi:MAG: hypothetical protein ACO3FR_11120, partial [Ilumatobacteraceae bacterium]
DVTSDGTHFPPTIYFQERNFRPDAAFPYVHRTESMLLTKEFTFYPGRDDDVIVLYGRSFPSGYSMSTRDLAQMLARDLVELEFPGFLAS